MLPAACQGIIAVQTRSGFDCPFLSVFHSEDAWDISVAERSFVKTLDGGCSSPVAAYGEITGEELTLTGLYVTPHGEVVKMTATGNRTQGEALGLELAIRIKGGE